MILAYRQLPQNFEDLIREAYPEVRFETYVGEDPEGIYVRATVDVEELDEVYDLVLRYL